MRGIYLLPNFFTAANLACGFAAVLKACGTEPRGLYEAAWLILLANIFDILDGRVARWTKATSKFGVQFDSLADLVAFGVAPAVLMFRYSLDQYDPFWGAVAGFAFLLCGACRLARFNVQAASSVGGPSYFFVGCPIPAASSLLASTVLVDMRWSTAGEPRSFLALTLAAAFMMVSTFPFPSMKKPRDENAPSRRSRAVLLGMGLVCAMVAFRETCIFALSLGYFLAGPLWHVARLAARVGPAGALTQPGADDAEENGR